MLVFGALLATAGIVGVSLAAYAAYLGTFGSIGHVTVSHLGKRPKVYNSAENILVIGAYDNVKDYTSHSYKPTADNGADTYVLVHVAPNHKGAVLISFPRDSMLPVYNCPASPPFPGQSARPGTLEPLNQTYSEGGPGCAWKTIEHQTGIRISNFIEVDYLGFEKFVRALGGANVCLPYAVNIPNDGLRLPAGRHHINASQALKFVRARDIGQWSDLQRIKRQQFFMISVMQSALHQGLLGNPVKLYSIAHAVAHYLTTNTGFGLSAMYHLARSMQGTNLAKVQLIEVPVTPYPQNKNKVIWQQPAARRLFSAVAHDKKVPKTHTKPVQATSHAPKVRPSQVRVHVLNGNGVPGGAAQASRDLTKAGFTVAGTGNASNYSYPTSVVEYGQKAALPAARVLKQKIPGSSLRQAPGLSAGTVYLIVGANFNGVRSSAAAKHTKPSVKGLAKSYNGVTGNANICKDKSAFSG